MDSKTDADSHGKIENRYDLVLIFDVQDGNPNGDPDADNAPRMDDLTQQGIVSNVCINRKLRNRVELVKGGKTPYAIYVTDGAILSDKKRAAYKELGLEVETMPDAAPRAGGAKGKNAPKPKVKRSGDTIDQARQFMCENYWDVRTFGAVMNTSTPAGTVRGPFQTTFARSVHPIAPKDHTITRCADENFEERKAGGQPHHGAPIHGAVRLLRGARLPFTARRGEDGLLAHRPRTAEAVAQHDVRE